MPEEEVRYVEYSKHDAQAGEDGAEKTLTVSIEDSADGAAIVILSGELDLGTVPRMEGALLEQLEQRPAVLVDLSGLSFIDSSGIAALIEAKRGADGIPLGFLVGPGSQVDRVFGIAGIGDTLRLFSDRQVAMTALAPRGGD